MNHLNEDLNDSALFCKSLIQKRKASNNVNHKNPKQLKLNFSINASEGTKAIEVTANKSLERESQNCSVTRNDVLSSYFQPKSTLNICPLCTKSFKTDSAYSTHMKQCAKTHKMTTQQLLGALELQKKHMQERKDFGLDSQNNPINKKTVSKKREERERDSYDLALGLALSKSLSNCRLKPDALVEKQKLALEQLGFTSSHIERPSKKKNECNKKTALTEQTAEDRERIIIEKLGMILLDEEQERNSKSVKQHPNSSLCSDQLVGLVNMDHKLWNKGENNEKLGWYVSEIKSLLLLDEGAIQENMESVLSGNLDSEISKLNLPQEEINKNWKKMINNSKFSDVIGRTKDCQNFYLHSVVLFARFPEILEKDYISIFEKHNLQTVLIFLEYLYCGTLNSLVKEEIQNLFKLAVEFNYMVLLEILNCIENNLSKCGKTLSSSEIEEKDLESIAVQNRQAEFFEKDLFSEENVVDLTQNSSKSAPDENSGSTSNNEPCAEKSYISFLQQEEEELGGKNVLEVPEILNGIEEESIDLEMKSQTEKIQNQSRRESDDSATMDLDGEFKMCTRKSSDCVILSSGSESKNLEKSRFNHSRTPSPVDINYEVPYYDPYDNFHCFSEEQFSPVGMHSQSLITGDISSESLGLPEAVPETSKKSDGVEQEESKKSFDYSTPMRLRKSFGRRYSKKDPLERSKKKRSDLSASRILRKSLGLQHKTKYRKSFQRNTAKRKDSFKGKDFTEVLTDSILKELSKSATLKSSTPVRARNFVEITPIPNREEFGESVTPSPNYSTMEETLLKEHLSKYGLKKNLGKNKARKILRHIYEELHPLYNTETGKVVKILPTNTPKAGKKAKPKENNYCRNAKLMKIKNNRSEENKQMDLNSSKEFVTLSDVRAESPEGLVGDYNTSGSDFENLSETLTQTAPSNPVDLPSAFVKFLKNNPEYHHKILLYEPIWLEELQKKLKENFKKHFKISDLMDYLDQKCITFRSATQVKNSQKKYEKKKKVGEEKKSLPS